MLLESRNSFASPFSHLTFGAGLPLFVLRPLSESDFSKRLEVSLFAGLALNSTVSGTTSLSAGSEGIASLDCVATGGTSPVVDASCWTDELSGAGLGDNGGAGALDFPRGGGGGAGSGLKRIPVAGLGRGTSLKRRSFAGTTVTFVYRSFSSFFVIGDSNTITNVSVIVAATSEPLSRSSRCAALIRMSASVKE